MNKEEILKMVAGRELNVLVAETVFGWIKNDLGFDVWFDGNTYTSAIKDYSTDISAAWEVAEKFQTYQVTKTHQVNLPSGPEDMYRAIVKANKFVAYAKTAPLAICRAALLAVMEEKT